MAEFTAGNGHLRWPPPPVLGRLHRFVSAKPRQSQRTLLKLPRPGNLWVTLLGCWAPKLTAASVDSAFSDVASTQSRLFFRSRLFSHASRGLRCAFDRLIPRRPRVPVRPIGLKGPSNRQFGRPSKDLLFRGARANCSAGRMRSAQHPRTYPQISPKTPKIEVCRRT